MTAPRPVPAPAPRALRGVAAPLAARLAAAPLLAVLLVILFLAACGGRDAGRATDPAGRALALARAARVRVVAEGFEPDARVLAAAHESLVTRHAARGVELERADEDDVGAPRLVLATVDSELGRALLERAGGRLLEAGGFGFAGRQFPGDLDLVRLAMADPERPGLPLVAWLGNKPAALARAASLCEFEVRARFECYRAGSIVSWGRLTADGPVAEGDVVALRREWGSLPRRSLAEEPEWILVEHLDPVAFARVFGRLAREHREPIARVVHRLPIEAAGDVFERGAGSGVDPNADADAAAPRAGSRFGFVVWLPTDRVELAQLLAAPPRTVEGAGVVLRYTVADEDGDEPLLASTWRSEADTGRALEGDEVRAAVAAFAVHHDHVAIAPVLVSTPSTGLEAREKRADLEAVEAFVESWSDFCADVARTAADSGADALHLGTATPSITRTREGASDARADASTGVDADAELDPEVDARERAVREQLARAWTEGIARARLHFDGELIYVAIDPWELERIGFLDELDTVGVELMPGIADRTGVRVEGGVARRLGRALEHARAVAGERRLVVFTGMPATADAPSDPRLPRGSIDVDVQREFLAAVQRVVEESEQPIDGLVLEEWAFDPRREGGRGFDLARDHLADALGALAEAVRGAGER